MSNSMRFVTDLSKGVLGKPDSEEMWTEIISHIPDEVLLKPNVKILSIACGHCTEAVIVAKRMLKLGISKEQVNNSIYLVDKYPFFTNEARKKYGFKNVILGDFLEWETDMKFDVIIGNPPYQHSSVKKVKLWVSFLEKGLPMLNEGGFLGFITPDTWINQDVTIAKKCRKLLSNYKLVWLNHNTSKYFNIGENTCAFIFTNSHNSGRNYSGEKIYFSENEKRMESICQKMREAPVTKGKSVVRRLYHSGHPRDFNNFSQTKSNIFQNKVIHSAVETWYTSLSTENLRGYNVIINNSGYYHSNKNPNKYIQYSEEAVSGANTFQITCESKSEALNVISFLKTKLYQFFVNHIKSGGFNATAIYQLPILDGNCHWDDNKVYEYFNLSDEEIALVELTIK